MPLRQSPARGQRAPGAETASGQARYALKTPYRDGTTHLVLEPLDLMARPPAPSCEPAKPPPPRQVAMSWARRLKRVFGSEIDTCARCGGTLKIIAGNEESAVMARILAHWERTAPEQYPAEL